jgi:hypothetical protein
MRWAVLTVAALILAPLGAVSSQAVQPRSGDRIRITSAPNTLDNQTARVLRVRNDTLFLQVVPAETLVVALAGVTRLEVSTARRRHTWQGAAIGALIGFTSGALIGLASGDDPPGVWSYTVEENALMFGVALGIPGLVIGTLVGFNSVSHRWTSVPLGAVNATPGLQVGRSGARLGVALSLSP